MNSNNEIVDKKPNDLSNQNESTLIISNSNINNSQINRDNAINNTLSNTNTITENNNSHINTSNPHTIPTNNTSNINTNTLKIQSYNSFKKANKQRLSRYYSQESNLSSNNSNDTTYFIKNNPYFDQLKQDKDDEDDNPEITDDINYQKNNTNENLLDNSIDEEDNNQTNIEIDNIRLTKRSKKLVVLRVIILLIAFVFFPFESLMSYKLDRIELNSVFELLDNLISEEVYKNFYFKNIIWAFSNLISLEAISIYSGLVYLLYHPFRAVKIMIFLSVGNYIITIMRMLYSAPRPFWYFDEEAINCEVSFANPSISCFSTILFTALLLFQYAETYKKVGDHYLIPNIKKVIGYLIFWFVFIFILILNIILKNNFVYQLFFALVISLIMLVAMTDLEVTLHNFLLMCFKTPYKTRKYKIHIFIYTLSFTILTVIIYAVTSEDTKERLYLKNVIQIEECSKYIFLFGSKGALVEVASVFSVTGIFWGAGYTVENEISKWWDSSKTLKITIMLFFSLSYFISLYYLENFLGNFELIFLLECIKFFLYYFIVFGYLPHLFQIMNINTPSKKGRRNLNSSGVNLNNNASFSFVVEDEDVNESQYVLKTKKRRSSAITHVNKSKIKLVDHNTSNDSKNVFDVNTSGNSNSKTVNKDYLKRRSMDNKYITNLNQVHNLGNNANNANTANNATNTTNINKANKKKSFKSKKKLNQIKIGIIDSIEQRDENFINYEDENSNSDILEVDEENTSFSGSFKHKKKSNTNVNNSNANYTKRNSVLSNNNNELHKTFNYSSNNSNINSYNKSKNNSSVYLSNSNINIKPNRSTFISNSKNRNKEDFKNISNYEFVDKIAYNYSNKNKVSGLNKRNNLSDLQLKSKSNDYTYSFKENKKNDDEYSNMRKTSHNYISNVININDEVKLKKEGSVNNSIAKENANNENENMKFTDKSSISNIESNYTEK